MLIVNFMIVSLLLLGLIFEITFILKRKKTIILKGKDDFFSLALAILFVVLILPLNNHAPVIESLRNILIYIFLFSSIFVKRGISEKGIEKFGYTIPWDQIQEIYIEEYQMSKVVMRIHTEKKKYKLQFSKYILREILIELEKHKIKVYMKESLEDILKMKNCK